MELQEKWSTLEEVSGGENGFAFALINTAIANISTGVAFEARLVEETCQHTMCD